VNFDEYLVSKKIDSEAFRKAEESLWLAWSKEFEQIHPNSFTVQKLNLINPVRRKYPLKIEVVPKVTAEKAVTPATQSNVASSSPTVTTTATTTAPSSAKPAVPRPIFKPKPKIN
jgi:hypothetical protein